jgi:hypothetical protein
MMTRTICAGIGAALLIAVTAAACGGGSSPTSPSTGGGGTTGGGTTGGGTTGGGGTATDSATITIGADGRVSPATVTIVRGGRVTMINSHNRNHEMASDPHPEHNECPDLNQWGFLQPGQQRTSGNLNTARTCRFHDHNEPSNSALQGSVIIQ